jgi:hypothetical protein
MYILDILHSEMSGSSRSTAIARMIWIKLKHKESIRGIVSFLIKYLHLFNTFYNLKEYS